MHCDRRLADTTERRLRHQSASLKGDDWHQTGKSMSRVMRATAVRHTVLGVALGCLAMSSIATANADDFDRPAYSRYQYGAPIEHDGICRVFHERRIDQYGRETIHRIRMCDEGPVYQSPGWTAAPQEYGYRTPPAYPGYYKYPRPPAPIGPTYYN